MIKAIVFLIVAGLSNSALAFDPNQGEYCAWIHGSHAQIVIQGAQFDTYVSKLETAVTGCWCMVGDLSLVAGTDPLGAKYDASFSSYVSLTPSQHNACGVDWYDADIKTLDELGK